jgi:type IX secretion system PorP/SprF family membrane protein
MRKSLLLIAVLAISLVSKAQQDPQLTNWMFDRLSFNPAAAGIDKMHSLTGFYRSQWMSYPGQPVTFLGNYNGLYNFGGQNIGLGFSLFSDQLGQETNTLGRLSAAYLKNINGGTFSAGLSLGFLGKKLGKNWICSDPTDPTCGLDGAVPKSNLAQNTFDLGLGIMYYKENNYYVGVSATHLTAPQLDKLSMQAARHFYVMGGKNFALNTADPMVVRTNVLLKTDAKATPTVDINANLLWNDMAWGGISYRPGDAIAPMAGFQYKLPQRTKGRTTLEHLFRLGVSYDATTSALKTYSSGSLEVFGTYAWRLTEVPLRVKYGNPRFL